jgi:two-component system, NtrC family, sensor kinase
VCARRRDGTEFVVQLTLTKTEVEGRLLYSMILVDISARLAAEAEKQRLHMQLAKAHKLESVGQLAAGVAHEINTPTQYVGDNLHFVRDSLPSVLALLQGYRSAATIEQDADRAAALVTADALAAELDLDYLTEELPRALAQAIEGTNQIAGIVSAMKAFCHPGRPQKDPIDLNAAITNTVNVSRNEWKYVAAVECNLAPDLPRVMCNGNEIKQVLLNVLVNAAQAIGEKPSPKGGVRGRIRLATRRSGDFAEIEISDDGPGIPEDVMPRLFEPFFTTKGIGKGTGQGLAIAHTIIVDGHDGEIIVRSQPGSGATFLVRLPL